MVNTSASGTQCQRWLWRIRSGSRSAILPVAATNPTGPACATNAGWCLPGGSAFAEIQRQPTAHSARQIGTGHPYHANPTSVLFAGDPAACPQLAEADIMAQEANSGFDPYATSRVHRSIRDIRICVEGGKQYSSRNHQANRLMARL
jgi:hypothetical protein